MLDDGPVRGARPRLSLHPPSRFDLGGLRQVEHAKRVCGRCQARLDCLRWVLETRQDNGIWDGTTEDERRILRRRQRLEGGDVVAIF
ncbi:MAG TPA: WhiB family transcriptional regulator [Streptosporangiaceae bacterium]|nr:WhiB family transcriptional regulator [Streptosporangiaceae bacterium]